MLGDYYVLKNVLTKEECQAVIDQYDPQCKTSRVGGTDNMGRGKLKKNTRSSKNAWVIPEDLEKEGMLDVAIAVKKMVRTYLDISRDIFRTPIDHLETPQFTKYEEQDHYQWHMDAGIDHSAFRDVSATMLLSQVDEDFTGGMLKFFPHPSSKHYFDRGDLILFSSNYAHRVCRVTSGTRYSIVLWGGRHSPEKTTRNEDLKNNGSWGLAN
tara:strand:- start:1759 stop:2391 length:633 start_codon:yes stop_codon:yes gene_type:complete